MLLDFRCVEMFRTEMAAVLVLQEVSNEEELVLGPEDDIDSEVSLKVYLIVCFVLRETPSICLLTLCCWKIF